MSWRKQNHQIPLTSPLWFNSLLATFTYPLFIQNVRFLGPSLTLALAGKKYSELRSGLQRSQQNLPPRSWMFLLSHHNEAGTSFLGQTPLALHSVSPPRGVCPTCAYLSQDALTKLCYCILSCLGFQTSWSHRLQDVCLRFTLKKILPPWFSINKINIVNTWVGQLGCRLHC